MYNTEEEAKSGLDTCGYAGKWAKGKDYVSRHHPDASGQDYWSLVREHFLALGGGYLYQRNAQFKDSKLPISGSLLVIPKIRFA